MGGLHGVSPMPPMPPPMPPPDRLADSYDRQVFTLVDRLTALVEPVLILLPAAAVGVIAFATVLPILQVGKDL